MADICAPLSVIKSFYLLLHPDSGQERGIIKKKTSQPCDRIIRKSSSRNGQSAIPRGNMVNWETPLNYQQPLKKLEDIRIISKMESEHGLILQFLRTSRDNGGAGTQKGESRARSPNLKHARDYTPVQGESCKW